MPRYRVRDTVTYERVWVIEAADEEAAIDVAASGERDADEEEQIDNNAV